MRTVWFGLLGGCIFGGGSVDAQKWPERAAKATCKFSEECAAAAFFRDYDDTADCRATNELALETEANDALAEECLFDEAMADACLDALKSSCEDAGDKSKTVFEPCTMVWNCDGSAPAPTTDSF